MLSGTARVIFLLTVFIVYCFRVTSGSVVFSNRVGGICESALPTVNPDVSSSTCSHLSIILDRRNFKVSSPGIAGEIMDPGTQCQSCLAINPRKRTITCVSCTKVYHLTCVGLTKLQANVISQWHCPGCMGRTGDDPPNAARQEVDLGEYISQCRSDIRVLRIIPKGAIISVADALQKSLDHILRENSSLAWGKLLSFGFWAIRQPSLDPNCNGRTVSLTTRVKRQVQDYLSMDHLEAPRVNCTLRRGSLRDESANLKRSVSNRFNDGDIRGAVRLLASSDVIAPQGDVTERLLQQKHPPAPANLSLPTRPDDEYPAPFIASEADVRKALTSFRPGAAGGPDGLRPSHLSALISRKAGEAGVRLLASLTEFVNLVLRGEVPEFARPIFYGATLCALSKKDGGIRPIAVGSTLRRLATKVGAKPLASEIGDSLRPVQLGFSTRGGCEAAAHAARRYLQCNQHRRVVFKVDMANAFNSIRRDVFLAAARDKAQGIYRLLWQAYSEPSTLFYGNTNLVSATGIQQGDPFGPALFSLGIDSLTRRVNTEFNVWYLDDGTIGDSPEKVFSSLQRLIHDLREVGLEINQTKCELVIINHSREEKLRTEGLFRELLPELKVVHLSDSTLLGAPLSEGGISTAVRERQEDLERLVARLNIIESHQAFVLLKNCFSLPKLQYILRASPAYREEESLTMFDETLTAALSSVTNVRFEGDSLVQAMLPVRLGGLGIRMSKDIALPAFISSLHSVRDLVEVILQKVQMREDNELQDVVNIWHARNQGLALPDGVNLGRQRTWDGPQASAVASGLLERADQISRARLLAASSRESGLWLNVLPASSIGTLLDPESFRIAIALRVGAVVCEPHKCRCGRMMDARGLHGLSCKYSAGRHPRHTAINDVVKRALQSAGIPSILEPVGVDRGDGKRPDGITIFPFSNGKCLCWDATCTDTYAETYLNGSAVLARSAACGAEVRKRRKYAMLAARFRFEPVAVETAGCYGESTGKFIMEIGRRITEATDDLRETYWLEQRIGLAVQRGNAYSILSSIRGRFDIDTGQHRNPTQMRSANDQRL